MRAGTTNMNRAFHKRSIMILLMQHRNFFFEGSPLERMPVKAKESNYTYIDVYLTLSTFPRSPEWNQPS